LLLIQPILRVLLERGDGKILITRSLAGHVAGAFRAVYQRAQCAPLMMDHRAARGRARR
jgi:short-subunit dehydrogenase